MSEVNTPAPPFPAIPLQFDVRRIADLLCSGFEGGASYWCRVDETIEPAPENLHYNTLDNGEPRAFGHIDFPLCVGGAVIVTDVESEGEIPKAERAPCTTPEEEREDESLGARCGDCEACLGYKTYKLDRETIERGLKLFVTSNDKDVRFELAKWIKEDDDASTGDTFLQLCLLGELKYG